jgi:hemerythrin-like domain-containing protein
MNDMKATNVLSEEHRVIERVLNTLEAGAGKLESGQAVRPEFFLSATDFIKGFADGCHHMKEEGVLFKRMESNTSRGGSIRGRCAQPLWNCRQAMQRPAKKSFKMPEGM